MTAAPCYRLLVARGLEWLRLQRLISEDDISAACEVTTQTVQRWHDATSEPYAEQIDRYLVAVGSSPALLAMQLQQAPMPPRWRSDRVVGATMRTLRERGGHSVSDVACVSGFRPWRIVRWEAGAPVTDRLFLRWLRALGAGIDYWGTVADWCERA